MYQRRLHTFVAYNNKKVPAYEITRYTKIKKRCSSHQL